MEKIITFAIAAYNSERFLDKCLDSFLCGGEWQEKIEVLIVNDGSTDKTEEAANRYCKEYSNIFRLINKENGGHGSVINTAIEHASGKYFKIIDADDWVDKKVLPKYIEYLATVESEVILTHYKTYDICTKKYVMWKMYLEEYDCEYTLKYIMENWKKMDRALTFHGVTYKTQFYKEKGSKLTEKVFYEDHEYATIPCCYSEHILALDLCLYIYRIGDVEQSVSKINQYKKRHNTEQVMLDMAKYYKNNNVRMTEYGKKYFCEKLGRLFMSYLVIAMLVPKNRRVARKEVTQVVSQINEYMPEIMQRFNRKYKVFLFMNYMGISYDIYIRMLRSSIYNKLKRNFPLVSEEGQ